MLAAELIECLLGERTFVRDIMLHDGVAVMLSLLHSDDPNLPLPLLRSLDRLASQSDCAKDIRQLGGINVLLSVMSSGPAVRSPAQAAVVVAICSVLTTLALDGEAGLQVSSTTRQLVEDERAKVGTGREGGIEGQAIGSCCVEGRQGKGEG